MVVSLVRGPEVGANPWGARTLEWLTTSPPPLENFEKEPVVLSHPYTYGEPAVEPVAEPAPAASD
jgi:cytochrome c oxidase subunit 1